MLTNVGRLADHVVHSAGYRITREQGIAPCVLGLVALDDERPLFRFDSRLAKPAGLNTDGVFLCQIAPHRLKNRHPGRNAPASVAALRTSRFRPGQSATHSLQGRLAPSPSETNSGVGAAITLGALGIIADTRATSQIRRVGAQDQSPARRAAIKHGNSLVNLSGNAASSKPNDRPTDRRIDQA